MKVIEEIAAERERQKSVEGWTPEHDSQHESRELALAAACYAAYPSRRLGEAPVPIPLPALWPWHHRWWKPTTPRRNLIKAAALIVAEIERLDRATTPPQEDKAS